MNKYLKKMLGVLLFLCLIPWLSFCVWLIMILFFYFESSNNLFMSIFSMVCGTALCFGGIAFLFFSGVELYEDYGW